MARKKDTSKRYTDRDGRLRVKRKAANGAGSVYFEKGRNRWVGRHSVVLSDGTVKKLRCVGPDEDTVRERLAAKVEEVGFVSTGPWDRRTVTVAKFGAWWLETVKAPTVEASSLAQYRKRLARFEASPIGAMLVADVRREHIEGFLAELRVNKLGPSTIGDVLAFAKMVFGEAVDMEIVDRDPTVRVRAPRIAKVDRRALTEDELRKVVAAAPGHRNGAAVVVLCGIGLRAGEALGLEWRDIDFERAKINVRQAVKYVDGLVGNIVGTPKTSGALGEHDAPAFVMEALKAHKVKQAAERLAAGDSWPSTRDGFVFRNTLGELMNRQGLAKLVTAVCESAGVDPDGLGTHGGRRSYVTIAKARGLDLEDIAAAVGHSDPKTTRGYVQSAGRRPSTVAAALDAVIRK